MATKAAAAAEARSIDLSATSSEGFFTGSVRCSARVMAVMAGGFAGAVGDGLRTYGETLIEVDPTRVSLNNGFVVGALAGYARFFQGMASSTLEALVIIAEAPREPMRISSQIEIDYEKLASAIATDEFVKRVAEVMK